MTISRVVGTTEDMVDIFIQDATVSTGIGLPNLTISTFSSYYHRSDMTSTSSVTLVSTGTLGSWSSGQFLQINSTFMRGWYQFCNPNGLFATGSTVALHMYGHPSMAPVVMRWDVTRFNNQSALVNASPVGVSSMAIGVSVTTFNSRVGVSSFDLPVGISSNPIGVNVTSYRNTAAVTTFAGYPAVYWDLGLTNNSSSTASFPNMTISTLYSSIAASAGSVDVSSFYGSPLVTTAAGILSVGRVGVSSFGITVGISSNPIGVNVTSYRNTAAVTTFAGYPATYFDLGLTNNSTSTVSFSGVTLSTYPTLDVSTIIAQMSTASISSVRFHVSTVLTPLTVGAVDVTSFIGSPIVTTAAGVLSVGRVGVSSFGLQVGVSTFNSRVGVSSFGLAVGVSSNTIGAFVTTMSVPVDVTSFYGTALVTTAPGYAATYLDLGLTNNSSSTVSFPNLSISSQSVSVGSVDVSSFYGSALVTSAAGVLHVGRIGVSSFGLPVGISSFGIAVGVSSFAAGVNVTSVAGIPVTGTGTSSDPWGP